mmetsp:Transcript_74763/g.178423  ORF Transcript_74763/g.178423 Transcript_74763/m.178423 type:complete len:203 (+) Transcript_74763:1991-2599(+)
MVIYMQLECPPATYTSSPFSHTIFFRFVHRLAKASGNRSLVTLHIGSLSRNRDRWFTQSSVCKVLEIRLPSKLIGVSLSSLYSTNFMTRETSSKDASWLRRYRRISRRCFDLDSFMALSSAMVLEIFDTKNPSTAIQKTLSRMSKTRSDKLSCFSSGGVMGIITYRKACRYCITASVGPMPASSIQLPFVWPAMLTQTQDRV